jgi:hypothetical protein
VHHGGWWVNPPGRHKHQRGKRPNEHHAGDNSSNKGTEETLPKRGLGVCVWLWCHISEYSLGWIAAYG